MLTWQWSDMIGTTERKNYKGETYFSGLYKGNADVIEVFLDEAGETYTMVCFIVDKAHYNNMKKDGCKPYAGCKVRLIREALTEKDLKTVSWELLDLGASVDILEA